jgi:hypothetical protein
VVGNRAYDTVYRTASEFARLMLKPAIDSEVIEQTINYLTEMYKQFGRPINETADKRATAYNTICNVVKEYSQDQYWAQQNSPQGTQLADISFNQAAEIATRKNENVHKYLGDNFSSSNNRAARYLRAMFRDRQNGEYAGGKIKVTSTDAHAELTLRWISNSTYSNNSNNHNHLEHSTKENDDDNNNEGV